MTHTTRLIASAVASVALVVSHPASAQSSKPAKKIESPKAVVAPVPKSADISAQAKVVAYNPQDLVPIRTRMRYVTLIVLPEGEEILEVACGDKEFWSITGTQNLAYVKPAQEGIKTNLNLVTQSGRIYSFILSEVSGTSGGEPDLKVVIEPVAESSRSDPRTSSSADSVKFVAVREVDALRQELKDAQEDARKTRESADAAIAAGVRKFVSNLRFAYRFEAGRKPFYVRAMGHDDRFTYIHARPEETPTLYEMKDGKPNLVSYDYDFQNGIYVVPKILGSGYLAIGKQRLPFEREE